MKQLPKLALSYRSVTLLIIGIILYMGWNGFQTLPRRDMPSIPAPVAQVITHYPGASAEDVEALITKKLELRFSELQNIESISSINRPGISIITVQLLYGSPTKESWRKLRNKVDEFLPHLPKNARTPQINDEFSDTSALLIALSGKRYSYRQLHTYAKTVRERLKRILSVGKVSIAGVQPEVINLYAKKEITAETIPNIWNTANILKSKNIIYPGATQYPTKTEVKFKTSGRVKSVEELKKLILSQDKKSGKSTTMGDLFRIERTYKRPVQLIRHKGERALIVAVSMRARKNVIKMGKEVGLALAELRNQLPRDLQLQKVINQPKMVNKSIKNFMSNLFQAIGIVLFVSILFMGFRSGMIMAIAIPISMLVTFWIMKGIGWDLQQISIAALIIALGMLVDNAIVITDNIFAHLEQGASRWTAAKQGASELTWPLLMSTLTTIAIFFPLGMMPSISGDFIRSIPVVVGIVLLASFFVAMSVTPLMSYYMLRAKKKSAPNPDVSQELSAEKTTPKPSGMFSKMYMGVLGMALRHAKKTVTLSFAVFVVSLLGFGVIGKEFFPKAERDLFIVDVRLPQGSSIFATETIVKQVEQSLQKEKGIKSFTSFVGKGAPRFDLGVRSEPQNASYGQIVVRTKEISLTPGIVKKLRDIFRKTIAGARISVKEFQRGPSVAAPVEVRIFGDDLPVLRKLSSQLKDKLNQIPGTYDVRDTLGYRVLNVDVKVDDYRASLAGLDHFTVAKVLRTLLDGYDAGSLLDEEDLIPLVIRAGPNFRRNLRLLTNLSIPVRAERTPARSSLLELATFHTRWDIARINRRNNQRYVTISSQVQGVLASRVIEQLRPQLKALDFPSGFRYELGGESEKRSEGFKDLFNAMFLGLLFILILLVVQFNSFRHTIVILATLPLSMIGAILGLFLTGNAFGFMAFLGVVSLCGVVVNNALVLLDYVQQRLREGSSYTLALQEAGLRRMRPILLTTMTTIGGLLPLMLFGGAMWTGMAAVLIFGLAVATILTLVVIPCLYAVLVKDSEQKRLQNPQPPQ